MSNKSDFNYHLAQDITQITNIINLLEDAARTERFIAKPRHPGTPKMFDLILTSYDKQDFGYYQKELKLRASPRQVTRWEFAVEILTLIDKDIVDNPIEFRELCWMRAKKFKWTQLARHFGYHRVTLKNKYLTVLGKLVDKIKYKIKFDNLDRNLYLIT